MRDPRGIRSDYKTPLHLPHRGMPNRHWRLRWLALFAGLVGLSVVMAKTHDPRAIDQEIGQTETPGLENSSLTQVSLELPDPEPTETEHLVPASANAGNNGTVDWTTITVRDGDTLARLLQRNGISASTIHALATAGDAGARLARLFPGDQLRIGFDEQGDLAELIRELAPERRLHFTRDDDGFRGMLVEEELETRQVIAHGVIESSLFVSGARAGLSNRIIMEMARIFGWDIDFAMDLRKGDEFRVVYEVLYRNGEPLRDGNIIAAEFVNQGHSYRALRYTNPDGETDYYAPDGNSMRRAFLRAPLEYTRITSGFGPRRHPTLHTMRNHNGVDYAARTGTPIRATGDGRIVRRGPWGGYGHTVVIQHGERYRTLYAHMSRYSQGQAVGSRVRQGDIVGYVGSSGLATGPHLHYEFLVDGRHRDPQRVELPSGEPVAEQHREHFAQQVTPLIAQLDTLQRVYAQRME